MKVIILAGGSGSRLWPLSRKSFPKQFLSFFEDNQSLLQKTLLRFLRKFKPQDILIVTNDSYFHLVKNQAEQIHTDLGKQILIEPLGKNTAPAIALSVKFLLERSLVNEKEVILISSSDYIIAPEDEFLEKVEQAEHIANNGFHITFGVHPHKPETGYGYIQYKKSHADYYDVVSFKEKPNLDTAQKYLLSGNYLWNAGIFAFQVQSFIQDLKVHCPEIGDHFDGSFQEMYQDFKLMPELSIDYALMEKSHKIKVIPLNLTWSDVGSWDSIYEILPKDDNQNVKMGNIVDIDTHNCLLIGDKRLIATVGVEDLLLIETDDAVFLGKRGESQKVKQLVDLIKTKLPKAVEEHRKIERPWGHYTILEEGERYKIKRILVQPQQKLSLQLHYHRSEHWVVIKGTAKVTLDDQESFLHENESVYVPKSTLHRLENPGKVPVEIIEVQVGEYVGEDDIVRFEDIYGRTPATTTVQ